MHISVPIDNKMEFINDTKVSPLLSKVQIKVCYVGQQPNRNGTVITKEVAEHLGQNLPGSPIVGYYNEDKQDFQGHTKDIHITDDKFEIIDMTKPYGFVPTDAKVWFQVFSDEGTEHEYLLTEGYIWTGIYQESKRIMDKGNNQSMELHKDSLKGFWTNDDNFKTEVFIINEGLIEKLCILGENVEPCFEGSQIKSHFSLETNPEFIKCKEILFSMINELKDILSKGGSQETMEQDKNVNQDPEFAKKANEEEDNLPEEEKKKKEEEKEKKVEENACGGAEKKKKYNLDEVEEYTALKQEYDNLETKYNELNSSHENLVKEIESLRAFKLTAERKDKQDMIDSFYMLSDNDKKDVIDHIDTYSLDDIEAKLSIICVRNKVSFEIKEDSHSADKKPETQFTLNLQNNFDNNDDDQAPAWVKAVRQKSN